MQDYAKVHEAAAQIADALGAGWSYDTENTFNVDGELFSYAVIKGPDFPLVISGPSYQDTKGHASVRYPRGPKGEYVNWLRYGTTSPKCAWTWGRDPKAVANHIRRSILVPMQEIWPSIAQQIDSTFNYDRVTHDMRSRAAALLGMTYEKPAESWQRERTTFGSSFGGDGIPPIEIQPSPSTWTMEIRLSPEAAERFVADFVKAFQEGRYS